VPPQNQRKFNPVQKANWRSQRQQEVYAKAEAVRLPDPGRRQRELDEIAEFIKKKGVTRVSSRKPPENE
jgi:hypothetical protein